MNEQHRFHPLFETSIGALCGFLGGVLVIWMYRWTFTLPYNDLLIFSSIISVPACIAVCVRAIVFRHRIGWQLFGQALVASAGSFVGIFIVMYIVFSFTPFIFDRTGELHIHNGRPRFWSVRGEGGVLLVILAVSAVVGIIVSRWFERHRLGGTRRRNLLWDGGVTLFLLGTLGLFPFLSRATPTMVFPPPYGVVYAPGTDAVTDAAIAVTQETVSDQRSMRNHAFFRVPSGKEPRQQLETMLMVKQFYEDQDFGMVGTLDSIGNGLLFSDLDGDLRVVISCTLIEDGYGTLLVTYGTR